MNLCYTGTVGLTFVEDLNQFSLNAEVQTPPPKKLNMYVLIF